jgi:hypothetical protein
MLEGMLRVCALQYERSWDKSLPYAEFSYNNSYQESLKMAPFEMLYGHDAKPHYFGLRLENRRFLDLTYCKKLEASSCCYEEPSCRTIETKELR